VDLQKLYRDKKGEKNIGLGHVCEQILGKSICKAERMSNWENRPLRKAQLHYATLDAYCQVPIVEALNLLPDLPQKEEEQKQEGNDQPKTNKKKHHGHRGGQRNRNRKQKAEQQQQDSSHRTVTYVKKE
jgi:ribonuclease D